MSPQATVHEVNGYIVEVVPVIDDILQAVTLFGGMPYTLCTNSDNDLDTSEDMDMDIRAALSESIRQRRSGEVVPSGARVKMWQNHLN